MPAGGVIQVKNLTSRTNLSISSHALFFQLALTLKWIQSESRNFARRRKSGTLDFLSMQMYMFTLSIESFDHR